MRRARAALTEKRGLVTEGQKGHRTLFICVQNGQGRRHACAVSVRVGRQAKLERRRKKLQFNTSARTGDGDADTPPSNFPRHTHVHAH